MVVRSILAEGGARSAAQTFIATIADDASATHPHRLSLTALDSADATRNATDALHHLSMLHGRHPGVVDHALGRTQSDEGRRALFVLADAFAAERELLARLVVAAGPIPSTPGQAETEASVVHQRHAIEMLAQSDRQGCAIGAALALALDWQAIRPLLDAGARRFGVTVLPTTLPESSALAHFAELACPTPPTERAMQFGVQQIAAQHRGMWDLLEARARARVMR